MAPVQTGSPGSPLTEQVTFFDLRYGIAIATFLLLAAVDHLLMAAPGVVRWYEENLRRGINPARWIEYSLSASVMIVLIAMLTGITNFYALLALFGVNAAMILFGFLMEQVNTEREQVTWWPFVFGCIAGAVPWISITIAIVVASQRETRWRGRSTPARSPIERSLHGPLRLGECIRQIDGANPTRYGATTSVTVGPVSHAE